MPHSAEARPPQGWRRRPDRARRARRTTRGGRATMPSRRWTRPVKQRRYRRNGALNDALLCRDIRRTLLSTVNGRPRACTPGKSQSRPRDRATGAACSSRVNNCSAREAQAPPGVLPRRHLFAGSGAPRSGTPPSCQKGGWRRDNAGISLTLRKEPRVVRGLNVHSLIRRIGWSIRFFFQLSRSSRA